MARIPKWFQRYLDNTKVSLNFIIVIALFTGITSFGLPTPPPFVKNFIEENTWIKWVLLWLLIFQGGSDQNIIVTNIAFGILFALYNLDWEKVFEYIKKYKKYFNISLVLGLFFILYY